MVAHTYNPSTQLAEAGGLLCLNLELQASLGYDEGRKDKETGEDGGGGNRKWILHDYNCIIT